MSRIARPVAAMAAALTLSLAGFSATPALASAGHSAKPTHLIKTHLTLHATMEKVTKTDKFKATVVAKLRAHKSALAGETVELFQRAKDATKWIDTGLGAPSATDGTVAFTFVQGASKEQYRAEFAGDSSYKGSHSGTITITRLKSGHSGT